jgi:HWE histidine kinase
VDAIARQTASKNPEDFIERFATRMHALSANQDLLVPTAPAIEGDGPEWRYLAD